MSRTFDYFYDFSSPYAYLAHEEVELVASTHNAEVRWRPFLLGGLFHALGTAQAPILEASENKRKHLLLDLHRWAEVRDLPWRWPSRFPMMTVLPLRAVLQLEGDDRKVLSRAIFRAYWGGDQDISDAGVLGGIINEAGFDAATLLAGCSAPDVKAKLRANTEELLQAGGVGAPAFVVGDMHIWGQDRFEFVERALQGWKPQTG